MFPENFTYEKGGWSIGHRLWTSVLKDVESGYRILDSNLFSSTNWRELLQCRPAPLLHS